MPNKTSILVLTSVYPRHEGDTEVPWLRASLRKLVESGCGVSVIAPSYKRLKNHSIDGIRVYRYRYAPSSLETLTHDEGAPSKMAKNPLLQLLAIPYVISGSLKTFFLCLKLKPKIIHVHWPFPHAFMALFAKIFYRRAKIVLNFHGAELMLAHKKKWVRPFLKSFIKRADAVIANSSFTAKKITEIYPHGEIEILPYGTTLDSRRERTVRRDDNGKYRVLFVGRHIERKGIDYLIKAAALLDADKYQVRIVGHGDRTARLMEQALREAPQQVVFLGKLPNEDLKNEYNSAGCFVLPAIVDSRGDTEGLGVVLIEAAEYGVPIVASGVGGIVDVVIDNKTGLLVKEKSPEELAAAIRRLHDDPDLSIRLVENCRGHVNTFFSWDGITVKQIELYKRL